MAGKNNFQRLLVIHVENGVLERPLFLRFSAEAEGSECAARLDVTCSGDRPWSATSPTSAYD